MKYIITILLLILSIFSYSQRMRIVDSLADFKVHVTDNIELADAVICIVDKYTKEECHWKFVKCLSNFTVTFVDRKDADFSIKYTNDPKNAYMKSEFLKNGLKYYETYKK